MATKALYPHSSKLLNQAQAERRYPVSALPADALMKPRDAERMLRRLMRLRWERLAPEYDDPINMLYDSPANEWTMGWDPQDHTLYMLAWQKTSWQKNRTWVLYVNGIKRFVCQDALLSAEAGLCRELMESPKLPFLSAKKFFSRLVDYQIPLEQREFCAEAFFKTLQANPNAWSSLREPFYQLLATDLGQDSWPTLDLLKIHRLDQKIPLVQILRALVQCQVISRREEKHRIHHLIERVHAEYERLGRMLTAMMQGEYDRSYQRFRQLISHGFWRVRLMEGLPTRELVTG